MSNSGPMQCVEEYGRRDWGGHPRTKMRHRAAWIGVLAVACGAASAQTTYRISGLGTLGGTHASASSGLQGRPLNASGQVTGASSTAGDAESHAFVWKNDGSPMQDLSTPGSGDSVGVSINDAGQITGTLNSSGTHAFLWRNDGSPMQDLGTLGGSQSAGIAINATGQITGHSTILGDTESHGFLWKNDGSPLQDLGTLGGKNSGGNYINAAGRIAGFSSLVGDLDYRPVLWPTGGGSIQDLGTLGGTFSGVAGINASGQVAGNSTTIGGGASHAFLWKNDGTPILDLGTFGGFFSEADAINDSGQVVGRAAFPSGVLHATLWDNNGTAMQDLGTLGGDFSLAEAINASGQVTGIASRSGGGPQHAFLWRNDGTPMHDLNDLVDAADPLKPYVLLFEGIAINDRGQVLARGTDSRTNANGLYLISPDTLPVAKCKAALLLTLTPGATTAAASIDNGSYDPDAGDTITRAQSPAGPYSVGTTPVMLTVTDSHGATSSCTTDVTVRYDFKGFFLLGGGFTHVLAGATVPVIFSLAGPKGSNIFNPGYPASNPIDCTSGAPIGTATPTGSLGFSYIPLLDVYVYLWKTDTSWIHTCRQVNVTLNDGTQHIARFKF